MHAKELPVQDWAKLRATRLRALKESGSSFLSNFERESEYAENAWRDEFRRGRWWILADQGDNPAGLIGATLFNGDWYLEYLWIASGSRRRGLAASLMRHAIGCLTAEEGAPVVSLWVLDGNHPAFSLYEQLGFTTDGTIQELSDDSGRKEIRMRLAITPDEG